MGSGKSTVAKALSKIIDFRVIEMDDLICQKTKTQNMQELFAKKGELRLRMEEIALARKIAAKLNLIISTGGGVVLNKIVLDYFKKAGGKVIFLHASFEQIVNRLMADTSRPLFKDLAQAKTQYTFRLPLYLHYADESIDVNTESADRVALQIKEKYGF
jgi:shikimate kinase